MRFDASRAAALFHELRKPQFGGPDGEARVADFVANQFERLGLDVERSEVAGSRFPQRLAPWIGWLGYGALMTSPCLLVLRGRLLASMLAFVIVCLAWHWLNAIIFDWIRPGRRWPPIETAPIVLASLPGSASAPTKVVFQVVLGGLKPDPLHFLPWNRYFFIVAVLYIPHFISIAFILLIRIAHLADPKHAMGSRLDDLLARSLVLILALTWVGILTLLSWEYRHSPGREGLYRVESRGLAVLLELARSWPRSGSRPIDPIFVAAGGQHLDRAGSREIFRRLGAESPSKPKLLMLFFAPGAGDKLRLDTNAMSNSDLNTLVADAARGLWLPVHGLNIGASVPHWCFEPFLFPAVALVGADPRALGDDSVDPQALHRAAQLATEIALRWAKKQVGSPEPGS
jgi:hypothetical protein